MIVYGDPQFEWSYLAVVAALTERVLLTDPDDIDQLRTLLVQAGQLEQAICDLEPGEEWKRQVCDLTDRVACRFYESCSRMNSLLPWRPGSPKRLLHEGCERLRGLRKFGEARLTIKVPEGFEFYALYPEQYCCATNDFLREVGGKNSKKALVVGIRSIGTTLSALVKAVLEAAGWEVRRVTVRPQGHPYDRQAQLGLGDCYRFDYGLIVDEGPGISGSSMASVARACSAVGLDQVAFFPGHNGEPGPSASEEVRQIWTATPRFFAPLERISWNGPTIHELLLRASEPECEWVKGLTDLSGGLWRKQAYASEAEWPAVCIPFERMKFLAGAKPGHRLFWKFSGFGSLQEGNPGSCGSTSNYFGFSSTTWIEGRRLTPQDAERPNVQASLCDQIARSCGKLLKPDEQHRAIDRLGEMLYWNVKEALGDGYADCAKRAIPLVGDIPSCPSYGDGRMAPCEWVQDSMGRIWKTDCVGHDSDHTIIGKQPVLWDVAGAVIEWEKGSAARENLVNCLRQKGIQVHVPHLRFFELAYSAFRMGQCSLSATVCGHDSAEGRRLQAAADRYRGMLERELDSVG